VGNIGCGNRVRWLQRGKEPLLDQLGRSSLLPAGGVGYLRKTTGMRRIPKLSAKGKKRG